MDALDFNSHQLEQLSKADIYFSKYISVQIN